VQQCIEPVSETDHTPLLVEVPDVNLVFFHDALAGRQDRELDVEERYHQLVLLEYSGGFEPVELDALKG
jgi:hypothetical protein